MIARAPGSEHIDRTGKTFVYANGAAAIAAHLPGINPDEAHTLEIQPDQVVALAHDSVTDTV